MGGSVVKQKKLTVQSHHVRGVRDKLVLMGDRKGLVTVKRG